MIFSGILVGAAVFLIIGAGYPLVIKIEYHFGKQGWWILLFLAILLGVVSVLIGSTILSAIVGAGTFSCLWGVHEIFEQEERVLKGWYPENPARHDYYERKRAGMKAEEGR